MVMSPYCSLAMQNNPRSTVHSLYRRMREIMKGKEIKFITPREMRDTTRDAKQELAKYWYEISVAQSQHAIIALTMRGIVEAWRIFNKDNPTIPWGDDAIIGRINSGDCGLVAIIAHHVLGQKYNISTEIWMNDNHCWITHNGTDFDTFAFEGYPPPFGASAVWSKEGINVLKKTKLTLEEACKEWMPCDTFGGYLIKGICDNYGIRFPQALQHCIDNAEEYDSPEMVEIYKQRAAEIAAR